MLLRISRTTNQKRISSPHSKEFVSFSRARRGTSATLSWRHTRTGSYISWLRRTILLRLAKCLVSACRSDGWNGELSGNVDPIFAGRSVTIGRMGARDKRRGGSNFGIESRNMCMSSIYHSNSRIDAHVILGQFEDACALSLPYVRIVCWT